MGKWEDTSHVTRTTVAYGSRNQNKDCSCGKRLRNLASVVNMNSADSFSTYTGLRVLLFKIAFSKGRRSSNAPFTLGHKLLTSSTENQSERIKYDKILIKKKKTLTFIYWTKHSEHSQAPDGKQDLVQILNRHVQRIWDAHQRIQSKTQK